MIPAPYTDRVSAPRSHAGSHAKPLILWWAVRGSNPRPSRCKRGGRPGGARAALYTAPRNDPHNPGMQGAECIRRSARPHGPSKDVQE